MTLTTVSLSILSAFALLGLVGSTGALVSGLWLLDFQVARGNTTVYLPILYWDVTLSDSGAVLNTVYWIIAAAFVGAILSTFLFVLSLVKVLKPRVSA